MKQFKGVIYQAINIQNGKSYIGKTTRDFKKYKQNHIKQALIKKEKGDKIFYRAIRKYGPQNFKWIILGEIESYNLEDLNKELNKAEKESIWLFNSNNKIYGYNMTKGGDGGDVLANHPRKQEIYTKIAEANKGQKRSAEVKSTLGGMKGKHHSEESKIKISEGHKGLIQTEEHKRKNSEANTGRIKTEEHLLNISKALKGRIITDDWKKKMSENHYDNSGKNSPCYIDVDIDEILKLRHLKFSVKKIAIILSVSERVIRLRLENPDKYR